ncbi:MAG: hypothetical protein ACRDNF_22110 [Streptosporangiaceae bacterium]
MNHSDQAAGLRVYPPNQTVPIMIQWDGNVCSGPVHQLSIGTVEPAVMTSGN